MYRHIDYSWNYIYLCQTSTDFNISTRADIWQWSFLDKKIYLQIGVLYSGEIWRQLTNAYVISYEKTVGVYTNTVSSILKLQKLNKVKS